jgi:two-component system LytT family response regulator
MKIRTIIVDDEVLSRRGVELRLRGAADFEIVAQCANGREALGAIQQYKPDLVFLDIQMPGMTGFEVLAHLPQESLPVLVFVTAYDQYAIQAFEARAVGGSVGVRDDELEDTLTRAAHSGAAEKRDRCCR